MKKVFLSFAVFASVVLFTSMAHGQTSKCDKKCVATVRDLLKLSYIGFSSSWPEKNNFELGDKAGVAILQIYKGKSFYKPDNIRTYLPVLRNAFFDKAMIDE